MKLVYRGVSYEYNPQNIDKVESAPEAHPDYNLTYRGAVYTVHPGIRPLPHLICHSIMNLLYRGANYRLNCAEN